MDWQLIEVFLRVAQEGSFTKAAEVLGTSQPTVSRQVRALEESLGVTLFARHARGFELTEMGRGLLETAREVDSGVQAFLRHASGMNQAIGGDVRISASEPVAAYLLTPFVAEFLAHHPEISLEVVAENRPTDLLRRHADIAVRMFRPRLLDLIARKIGAIPLAFYAHQDYLARRGTPNHPSELKDHVLIGYDRDDTGFEILNEFGIDRTHFALRTDSLVTQFEAIAAGVGIGGAQAPIMEARPGICRILPEVGLRYAPVWLAIHSDLRTNPTIRVVYDNLVDYFTRFQPGATAESAPGTK